VNRQDSIIRRLHQLYGGIGGFICAPASPIQIKFTEQHLHFPLPPSLRRYYGEVANGGFGLAYGIIGVCGGYRDWTGQGIAEARGNLFDLDMRAIRNDVFHTKAITLDIMSDSVKSDGTVKNVLLVGIGCGVCDDLDLESGWIYRTEAEDEDHLSVELIAEDIDEYLEKWLEEMEDTEYYESYLVTYKKNMRRDYETSISQ
jgi:hypothetical protein